MVLIPDHDFDVDPFCYGRALKEQSYVQLYSRRRYTYTSYNTNTEGCRGDTCNFAVVVICVIISFVILVMSIYYLCKCWLRKREGDHYVHPVIARTPNAKGKAKAKAKAAAFKAKAQAKFRPKMKAKATPKTTAIPKIQAEQERESLLPRLEQPARRSHVDGVDYQYDRFTH